MTSNPGSPPDSAIVAGCKSGSAEARQRLYETCDRPVSRVLVRMVGKEDVDDLKQQVFLKACAAIDQFNGDAHLSTWVYRIAVNEALQHLRRRKNNTETLDETCVPQINDSTSQVGNTELLEIALQRVTPESRTIFVLREMEELSYQEIGQMLDIPEGTVGSRLNKARNELQKQIVSLGGWEAK